MADEGPNKKEKPKAQQLLPEINLKPDQVERIARDSEVLQRDLRMFIRNYDILYDRYPEEFQAVEDEHPAIKEHLRRLEMIGNFLTVVNIPADKKIIQHAIDEYNFYAQKINHIFEHEDQHRREAQQEYVQQAIRGELPFDENSLSPQEKVELQQFSQFLWQKLFPESNVDQFVRWVGDQSELEGYQKILLAPANGIEAAVGGLISLLHPDTYRDLFDTIKATSGMSYEELCTAIKNLQFTYQHLSTEEKIAPVISLIYSILFLGGGAAKITSLIKTANISSKVKTMLLGLRGLRAVTYIGGKMGKAIPIGIMAGLSLRYFPHEDLQ